MRLRQFLMFSMYFLMASSSFCYAKAVYCINCSEKATQALERSTSPEQVSVRQETGQGFSFTEDWFFDWFFMLEKKQGFSFLDCFLILSSIEIFISLLFMACCFLSICTNLDIIIELEIFFLNTIIIYFIFYSFSCFISLFISLFVSISQN